MKRLVLSICLLAVVALASVHGTGMVKTAALAAADARDIRYLNVRNSLGVIATAPHPTASPRQPHESISGSFARFSGGQILDLPFVPVA